MNKKFLSFLTVILLLFFQGVTGQTKSVSGIVTDDTGSPLPGVNVVEKGTSNGTSTDFDGNYVISVDANATLVFSSLGYKSKEVSVNGKSTINTSISEDASELDEVVVTALGIRKETKALGYSLTEVGGEEIATIKTPNAINSLQGKIAGVNISQNSTGAAGSSRVIIRGSSSLSGENQPLYVVDGIPINNANNGAASMWGGSDGGDGISSLNPDDIESISVLKGGAASALYGSRAAGGVIIVTTKSGKDQQGFGVEVSSQVTFDQVNTSLQDYQTDYGQGIRGETPANQAGALEAGFSSWGPKFDGSLVPQFDGVSRPYSYTGNNIDKFYRTGSTFINTVALTNASENLTYRLSASDLNNEDILPNAGLNRKSFSLNASSVMSEKLTSSVNVKYIIEKVQNRARLSDSPGNANFSAGLLPGNLDVTTLLPATDENGLERQFTDNTFVTNPYFSAYNFRRKDQRNRIIASTSLRYEFTDWLSLTGRIGIDNDIIRRTEVEPFGTGFKPRGGISDSERRTNQVDADIILAADKDITDKFAISALVGANTNHLKSENLFLGGNDFIVPGLEDIGNTVSQSRSREYSERKIGSLYGSIELSYDRWAYVTFTGRNDWFSTLSFPGKTTPNDDFYPSINGSLIISDALELPNFISFLKLRGGYSEVAGGAQNPYALGLTYGIFGVPLQGQPTGAINGGTVPNANLVAFSKNETEIGLDLRMFNNRLSFDLAYYKNNTTNDIVDVATSPYSGYGGASANLGEVSNKGFEFLVSGTPIRTDNFSWNVSINGAYNESLVVATDDVDSDVNLDEPRTQNVRITHRVGERYGTIIGVSYERDANGVIKYDIDADGVPRAVEGERKILGEGVAPLTMGFTNTFTYKNLSLNILIDGKFGGQIFSGTNTILYGNGLHKITTEGRETGLTVSGIDNATDQPFTTTVAPENLSTYWGEVNDIAEEFVEDSDYIKFRQLSLGYSLPKRALENVFLTNVNVSFIASNLFYISRSIDNIDPESAYTVGNSQGLEYFGVPASRNYGMSINLKF
ncbi:TonB-linked SusC/RagA family outer membrane protein [Maribacter spongiicola]|uniref:TonB-linked SusC/RagA family outer membrane protein n=1 Tax=Maribacter spongiicola TaxID=1206753 RepID=A0A4R7K676_9FLAO|nr:SusC/RagA family TonB-linked outer membrane protein [Maribacter spongiicola]TDT46756.1 TonB-linked SusC/RagA family outer membrane protein [Maribacter spongiicola]